MDVLTAIDTRASSSRLIAPAPTSEDLDRILTAGARAPDHGRLAPWRFVVLEDRGLTGFADALAAARRRKDPDSSEADLNFERSKAARAPMIVVVAARTNPAHKVPENEQVLAAAAAAQNMILAAHALGFGTMWKTGAPAYDPAIKTALGLEPSDHVVAFLYLGTPVSEARPRAVSLDGIVTRL